MFVDELTITAKAGDGGDGVVRWHRERFKPKGGPSGGNGANGGDVYLRAIRDINILSKYKHNPSFVAENGEDGAKKNMHGANGEDCYIDVPVGSLVTHQETGIQYELLEEGETVKILSGGVGGYGNTHFKSSRNVTPEQATPGKPGEEGIFFIELQLLVDAGFIGLPSAGKSTLLNAITNAHAKTGEYPFTTLSPNLGAFHGYILADIPGLIEGAADGKGLGHAFLKHISRTKALVHCISFEQESAQNSYKIIRNEIAKFDETLLEKPELLVLTKRDLVSDEEAEKIEAEAREFHPNVVTVSAIDDESLERFTTALSRFLRN